MIEGERFAPHGVWRSSGFDIFHHDEWLAVVSPYRGR